MTPRRRPRGSGALFKDSAGYWTAVVELPSTDGKRRQRRVRSRNRNTAIRKLRELRAEIDAGRVPASNQATVAVWLDHWLKDIRGPRLRPGTKAGYQRAITKHINPAIGGIRLERLTPQHVRQMSADIPASRTAQLAHVVLRSALNDAIKEGLLTRNVASVAGKPRHTTTHRTPLSAEQAKHLLRCAIERGDPLATRWAAAFLLGARQGEILGLQWSRCDLDSGLAEFSWQLQQLPQTHGCGERNPDGWPCGRARPGWCPDRRWDLPRGFEYQILHRSLALTRPKTRAGVRVVPIPAPLWAMLRTHPYGVCNPHDLVWHHDDGRPFDRHEDYQAWQNALAAAGIPPAPLHVARNTCATLLAQAGVPEDVRMAILGQTSVTAHRAYVYRDQLATRQAMTALDRLLD